VAPPQKSGDRLLEALDVGSLHELSGFENGGDGATLVLTDPWFC
jgi:hypothetical protein